MHVYSCADILHKDKIGGNRPAEGSGNHRLWVQLSHAIVHIESRALIIPTDEAQSASEVSVTKGEFLDVCEKAGTWWAVRKADGLTGGESCTFRQVVPVFNWLRLQSFHAHAYRYCDGKQGMIPTCMFRVTFLTVVSESPIVIRMTTRTTERSHCSRLPKSFGPTAK